MSKKEVGVPRVVFAKAAAPLPQWEQLTGFDLEPSEMDLLKQAHHFGVPVVWGLVDDDPLGQVWPSVEPRPIACYFQCIHITCC